MRRFVFAVLAIAALAGPAAAQVLDYPTDFVGYRDQPGVVLQVRLTGEGLGMVIGGSPYYSDDTDPAVAAVHAGLLRDGDNAVVNVIIGGPQEVLPGGDRNRVGGLPSSSVLGSYAFVTALVAEQAGAPLDPGPLDIFRGLPAGTEMSFTVTGWPADEVAMRPSLYGDGIYTDDARLSVAAVHAGVLKPGATGVVTIRLLGPHVGFTGAKRNEITSIDWPSYPGSFEFVGAPR